MAARQNTSCFATPYLLMVTSMALFVYFLTLALFRASTLRHSQLISVPSLISAQQTDSLTTSGFVRRVLFPPGNGCCLSLRLKSVHMIWKTSCKVSVPKQGLPSALNDFWPVSLTSYIMKTLDRLVLRHFRPLVRRCLSGWHQRGGCHHASASQSLYTPGYERKAEDYHGQSLSSYIRRAAETQGHL